MRILFGFLFLTFVLADKAKRKDFKDIDDADLDRQDPGNKYWEYDDSEDPSLRPDEETDYEGLFDDVWG